MLSTLINIKAVAELAEITVDSIRTVYKMASTVVKVKLIGAGAKELTAKIKDENVTFTGMSNMSQDLTR